VRVVPHGQAVATTSDSTALEFARLLADQVYQSLRSRILRGELRPGERLPLPEIAHSLGVSLVPVKSAVNRLAADGLVVMSPRIGTVVAPVSEADVREVYQVRLILEPQASQTAAATLSDDELRHLASLVDQMEASAHAGYASVDDYLRELEMDGEFHASIVRGVRNERLNAFYATIQASIIVARAMYPRVYRDTEELTGGHRRILDALVQRDGESARQAAEEHLRAAEYEAIRHMAASRSG
jgi:DNA-binding GntR family transcriptional regulator